MANRDWLFDVELAWNAPLLTHRIEDALF
jgi:hypothetical protein